MSTSWPGEIIGDEHILANPRTVEWGSAPILVRSTKQAGSIKIKAEVQFPGIHAPTPVELEIESVPYDLPMLYRDYEVNEAHRSHGTHESQKTQTLSDSEKAKLLQEVEAQQADFGIQK